MRKAWKMAVLGTAFTVMMAESPAFAADLPAEVKPHAQFITYKFYQNASNPAFPIAWEIMKPLYKGSQYDVPGFSQVNPLIGIGEFDLNGDKLGEIIAFPTEDEAEAGMYCTMDSVCPHYVIDISGEKPKILGVLPASSLDRGDKITNGFWELKAYTHDWTVPRTDEYDLYVYNKEAGKYMKASAPTLEK